MRIPGQGFNLWDVACFDALSAAISGGTAIIGGLLSKSAASDAAGVQSAAATRASDQALAQYKQTREDLAPYRGYGINAGNALQTQLPQLTSQFAPTQASLEATPGYQFNLSQGLQGVQNSAAARGLGISGAALKGAANYATGLADNTLQTQFNIDQANKTNAFAKFSQMTGQGQGAATGGGYLGNAATQNAGNFATSGAQSLASGIVGGTNALTGGATNAANQYQQFNILNSLRNQQSDPNGQGGALKGNFANNWNNY
jgi:hypothetical protein